MRRVASIRTVRVRDTDSFASIILYLCLYQIVLVSDEDQDHLVSVLEFVLHHEHYDNALLHKHLYIRDDTPLVKYHRCSTALIVGDGPASIAAQLELIVPQFLSTLQRRSCSIRVANFYGSTKRQQT